MKHKLKQAQIWIRWAGLRTACFFRGHIESYIGFKEMPDWVCKRCGYCCEPYSRI